jgi:hypothetical protein
MNVEDKKEVLSALSVIRQDLVNSSNRYSESIATIDKLVDKLAPKSVIEHKINPDSIKRALEHNYTVEVKWVNGLKTCYVGKNHLPYFNKDLFIVNSGIDTALVFDVIARMKLKYGDKVTLYRQPKYSQYTGEALIDDVVTKIPDVGDCFFKLGHNNLAASTVGSEWAIVQHTPAVQSSVRQYDIKKLHPGDIMVLKSKDMSWEKAQLVTGMNDVVEDGWVITKIISYTNHAYNPALLYAQLHVSYKNCFVWWTDLTIPSTGFLPNIFKGQVENAARIGGFIARVEFKKGETK